MGYGWQIVWLACGATTLVAGVLAHRGRRVRYVGRASISVLFIFGGALLHVVNLVSGLDYSDFADPAFFGWVTDAWRAVVGPNQLLFIGLLAVFEVAVGVLVVSGGRATQIGLMAVLAFYLALCLFGWFEVVWFVVMLPPILLLLHAERVAAPSPRVAAQLREQPADVGTSGATR